uniref:Uncharacterized protein n=1 Tax=Arundo donax TaxID=35708 RepID=A0A0A9F7U7_ARUDO
MTPSCMLWTQQRPSHSTPGGIGLEISLCLSGLISLLRFKLVWYQVR